MGERKFVRARSVVIIVAGLAVGHGFASAARADVFSFTYSELDGDFATTGADTGIFTAVDHANVVPFHTQGDVTRLVPVADSTTFDFADAAIGSASVDLSVATSAITDDDALALGVLTLADVDGDTITGNVTGQWLRVGASANLIALLTDVTLNNTSQDGTFNGTDGKSWSMTFDSPGPYHGNIIALAFNGWFTDGGGTVVDFNDITTLASGVVTAPPTIPEPMTLSILALSGLALLRPKPGRNV